MKKLFILLVLLIPAQTFCRCCGGGWGGGGGWVGPALFGGTMAGLTTAAIASSNRTPQTVVIEQPPEGISTKQEINYLKKQVKKVVHDNKQLVKMIKELQEQNKKLQKLLNLNQTAQ